MFAQWQCFRSSIPLGIRVYSGEPLTPVENRREPAAGYQLFMLVLCLYALGYPVTSEARFVAVLLMCAGVGLFGTFSGFLAAWFIGPHAAEHKAGQEEVVAELTALRNEVADLRTAVGGRRGEGDHSS